MADFISNSAILTTMWPGTVLTKVPNSGSGREIWQSYFGWLLDLGYVEGKPETTLNRVAPFDYYRLRLTGQGAVFLETFRDQDFYANVKQKAKAIGCGQMPHVLLKIGERLVESFFA